MCQGATTFMDFYSNGARSLFKASDTTCATLFQFVRKTENVLCIEKTTANVQKLESIF